MGSSVTCQLQRDMFPLTANRALLRFGTKKQAPRPCVRACVRAASGPLFSLFSFFALAPWPRRLRASLAPSACAILVAAFVYSSGHRDFSVAISFQSSKKHVSLFSSCGFLFCRGGRQRNARNRCEFVRFRTIERERQRQTHIHQMNRCFWFVSCVCEEGWQRVGTRSFQYRRLRD